ncbi:MAG: hypothetical protein ABIF10_05930 [Candidatus Woesearchaeota archaeon]
MRWFFLFFFCIPFVSAVCTETLHDGWHYANESFAAGNLNIALSTNSLQDGVAFRYGAGSILVHNKTCDETQKYIFCVDDTRQGSFDYYWRFYHLQFKLRILAKLAKLELSRTFSDTELFSGESCVVNTKVSNTGSFKASGVVFKDSFPGFVITESSCPVQSGTVTWAGALSPGQVFECSYTLVADSNFSFDSVASIGFDDGMKNSTTNSDSVQLSSFGSELQFIFNRSSFQELGESRQYNITITNAASEDVMLRSFSLTVPYGLVLSRPKLLRKMSEYRFEFSAALAPGSITVLSFNATPQRVKDFVLAVQAQYDTSGKRRFYSSNFSIGVKWKNLTMAVASESNTLVVSLRNPGQSLEKFDVLVQSPCLSMPIARQYSKFLAGQSVDISQPVINHTYCDVDMSVNYETIYGQSLVMTRSFNVSIGKEPISKPVSPKPVEVQQEAIESPATKSAGSKISTRLVGISVAAVILIVVGLWFFRKRSWVVSKEAKVALEEFKEATKTPVDEKNPEIPKISIAKSPEKSEETLIEIPAKKAVKSREQVRKKIAKAARNKPKKEKPSAKEPKGAVFRF